MPPKVAKIEVSEEEMARTKKLMEEAELKKLRREFMLMKDKRTTDAMMEKQKKVIQTLASEQHNLVNNLQVMETQRRCVLDSQQKEQIFELFGQGDSLDLEIAKEKRYIADLEAQIRKQSVEVEMQRKGIQQAGKGAVSDFLLKLENQHADRSLAAWKSRLHAEYTELGKAMKENADLRRKIEFLLQNKKRFNAFFDEMMGKLTKGKKMLQDIVENSTLTFKSRDEVARKIQALKQKDAADLRKRQEEMQDLEMKLSDEQILTTFKSQVLKSRALLSGNLRATKKATMARLSQEEHMKHLLSIFAKIKEETELASGEEVCEMVDRRDAENFSLFNYNNELRCQLEVLTEETVDLMRKLEEEQDNEALLEEEHERQTQKMEQRLTEVELMANDLEEQHDASHRLFDRLLSKVQALFDMTSCDHWILDQLLGDNSEVTVFNYRLYLDLVESRLLELLNVLPLVAPEIAAINNQMTAFTVAMARTTGATSTVASVVDRKLITRQCPECSEKRRSSHVF